MKKKMVCMMLVSAMVAAAMTGCGNASEATGEAETANTTGDTAVADNSQDTASGTPVEVEFWYSGGKTAVGVIQGIVDSFNESQSQYHVSTVTQADYDETYQKLQAGIAGNAAPDLVLLNVEAARNLDSKSLLADLQSMIDADSEFQKDNYLSVFYDQGVDDANVVFGLPAYGTTQVMYYNKAAFEEAGIHADDIKTWADLADAAQKIKATGNYEYGWEPMWGADNMIDAAFSNGAKIFSDDGTQVTINTPEWVDVWESFRTWIHDDKTMAIHSGGQGWEYWYATIDDVIAGKAGGYTGSSGDQADLDFSIVAAIEQPAWSSETSSAPMAETKTLSVLEGSSDEEKQGAFEFIKYFTNADNQAKWTMSTGYVAENPQAAVPFAQAAHGTVYPYDPTNGAIKDALKVAADKVEIDGIDAKTALDEAQATAQAALDEALGK